MWAICCRRSPGDNSNKLCALCGSEEPGEKCTDADPYAGMEGAFRCLLEAGDIAFVKHSTPREVMAAGARRDVGVRVAGEKAITSTAVPRECPTRPLTLSQKV